MDKIIRIQIGRTEENYFNFQLPARVVPTPGVGVAGVAIFALFWGSRLE